MAIDGIGKINLISTPASLGTEKIWGDGDGALSFGDYLKSALDKVNDLQNQAESLSNDLAAGKTDNIHQVMIAAEKADMALQFTMQIRNKILDAYNEIMRMQI